MQTSSRNVQDFACGLSFSVLLIESNHAPAFRPAVVLSCFQVSPTPKEAKTNTVPGSPLNPNSAKRFSSVFKAEDGWEACDTFGADSGTSTLRKAGNVAGPSERAKVNPIYEGDNGGAVHANTRPNTYMEPAPHSALTTYTGTLRKPPTTATTDNSITNNIYEELEPYQGPKTDLV
eukprot:m.733883 g.733883  ORF g.733883 m.733883 type:complete len:176 (+) comp23075_c0_seq5:237-764(+)